MSKDVKFNINLSVNGKDVTTQSFFVGAAKS